MTNIISVSSGTDPGRPDPRVFARFLNAGGTSMVPGCMNVKNRALAPVCCQGYSSGSQSTLSRYPGSVLSASTKYKPITLLGQRGGFIISFARVRLGYLPRFATDILLGGSILSSVLIIELKIRMRSHGKVLIIAQSPSEEITEDEYWNLEKAKTFR